MAKKGYAYRKAIELIAFEKGLIDKKPSLPKSSAKRGAIISWKNKLARGYRPRSPETKKAFDETSEKTKLAVKRPFLKVEQIRLINEHKTQKEIRYLPVLWCKSKDDEYYII